MVTYSADRPSGGELRARRDDSLSFRKQTVGAHTLHTLLLLLVLKRAGRGRLPYICFDFVLSIFIENIHILHLSSDLVSAARSSLAFGHMGVDRMQTHTQVLHGCDHLCALEKKNRRGSLEKNVDLSIQRGVLPFYTFHHLERISTN